ncbi:SWIM zinc finger family protein [Streptomyces sp. H036]|uniref:SWIM zinc finger family protein n=1 Tax=Streptomyces sp. H036 TaxID=1519487 RepID=UPI0006B06453|nr:SWIM zinc finger family protein [Streptomyces sp. H036]KOV37232.1 hypothetical protein ADK98_37580 [Streptomyces sp. H036]
MTLTDHNPYRMRFTPSAPLPDDELYERAGAGRLWLDALAPRTKSGTKGPFGRARAYARTAPVTHLVLEPGTIRCWINDNTGPAPASRAYVPQPHPTIHIPVLDHGQWHDLTVITRHLTDRFARLSAEDVLQEITSTGARNGIHLLPTLDQCRTSCSCSSRSALCKHAATALLQVARYLDTMPLVLLLLRGRSPVDFFAGLQDPDHPSLHAPRHLPSPPATPAQTAHDQWERVAQPSLPPVPALPEQPTTPVLAVVDGFDGRTLADLAAETAQRAYALLSALIHPGTDTAHTAGNLAEAEWSGTSPTSRQLPTIPLQQRLRELQEATGMTKAELAQAVRDWGLGG